ncbi:MAG: nucleotidyltransferase [Halothiobacillaceae bacterium]|nr:MAG: nucleotidyltransferase [Halothiobacillaceae bacterium]
MTHKLDLSALNSAITSLGESIAVVSDSTWFYAQSPSVQNTLVAGVIQNFEFVYEISIKMLRRRLELDAASPSEVDQDNFRDLLRSAAEKGLIADVEAWFTYRKMRNTTAHTYDHEKAQKVYQGTLAFLAHAQALLQQLEARNG